MSDYIIIDGNKNAFVCTICKEELEFSLPQEIKKLAYVLKKFKNKHEKCNPKKLKRWCGNE